MTTCQDCGMVCEPTEFHPFAACLMFKACHNGGLVRDSLQFLAEEAVKQEREACAKIVEELLAALYESEVFQEEAAEYIRTAVPAKE